MRDCQGMNVVPPIPHDANSQMDQARPTEELIYGEALWVGAWYVESSLSTLLEGL